jgi:hypothetical protein
MYSSLVVPHAKQTGGRGYDRAARGHVAQGPAAGEHWSVEESWAFLSRCIQARPALSSRGRHRHFDREWQQYQQGCCVNP